MVACSIPAVTREQADNVVLCDLCLPIAAFHIVPWSLTLLGPETYIEVRKLLTSSDVDVSGICTQAGHKVVLVVDVWEWQVPR